MRLSAVFIFSFLIALPAIAARQVTTQIHEIDFGTQVYDEVLVFLKSGDVARLQKSNLDKIELVQSLKSKNQWFTFTLDKNRMIKKVKLSEAPKRTDTENLLNFDEANYTPTTVASMKVATSYIAESRQVTKEETQCFNRAMVWSYEWWRKHSLKSKKVFIFWPKEYVRKYQFKWWFHVSPYVHVLDSDGVIKERVLDVKWLDRPYNFQDWADYHATKDVKCRVVEKYSDYADYPFDTDRCYFIRANMYTWQPADLEMNEAWGYTKDAYNMDEVRAAYLEAFDIKL